LILDKNQLEDIGQRIDFLQIQIGDLKRFNSLDWKTYNADRDIQRNIERLIENVANAAIDICKIILAGEEIEMPNSYKEIILKLGTLGILDDALAIKMANYASLRNFLAHRYLDLKWEKIKNFRDNAQQDFEAFTKKVLEKNRLYS